jgi:hypothetical protein
MLKYKQHLAYSPYDSNKKIKKTWQLNTFEFISFLSAEYWYHKLIQNTEPFALICTAFVQLRNVCSFVYRGLTKTAS